MVEANAALASSAAATPCIPGEPTFFAASRNETDKVTVHHYQHAYQAHVAPRRCAIESFLEIGLGCGMSYGAGKSVPLWLSYLPRAKVSLLEYSLGCATDFAQTNPLHIPQHQLQRLRIFWGDQSVPEHLRAVAAASGPYDVVVDDGGHTMKQQLVTLATLLPLVNPGGLYIVEDLGTSGPEFVWGYQYNWEIQWTMVEYINAMVSKTWLFSRHILLATFSPPFNFTATSPLQFLHTEFLSAHKDAFKSSQALPQGPHPRPVLSCSAR